MPEYTVAIESPPTTLATPEQLQRFTEHLVGDGRALHPATSLNPQTGVVSCTFRVSADSVDDASWEALWPYWEAVTAAGGTLAGDSAVRIERQGEATSAFSAEVRVRRSE
jgi:hypothetical protein